MQEQNLELVTMDKTFITHIQAKLSMGCGCAFLSWGYLGLKGGGILSKLATGIPGPWIVASLSYHHLDPFWKF